MGERNVEGGKGGLTFGARTRAGPGRVGRGGDADISVSILRRMLMEWRDA